MGNFNSIQSNQSDIASHPLSNSELKEFRKLFTGIPFDDAFQKLLQKYSSRMCVSFPELLLNHLTAISQSKELDFDFISNYFGVAMRTTTVNLVAFFWNPLTLIEPVQNDISSLELLLIMLVCEYASFSEIDTAILREISARLHRHYEKFIADTGQEKNLDAFNAWINQCFPLLTNVLLDKLHSVCFSEVLPKLRPNFVSPNLNEESAVVTDLDLLPLAFIDQNLHEKWIRLYTTDVDGRSFNRIAYHLLGYEVLCFRSFTFYYCEFSH